MSGHAGKDVEDNEADQDKGDADDAGGVGFFAKDGDPDGGDGELGRCLRGACSTLGQDVVVTTPTGLVRGRAIDVRPGLVLRDAVGGPAGEDGAEEFVISAGDVASARLGTPTGT